MNGIEHAALGVRYLIKYNDNKNSNYLKIIKECIPEIKFWSILTLFCNNMDALFKEIPDFVLNDVFTMQRIEKESVLTKAENSYYDYGFGYESNFHGDYRDELRVLRNALAHGDFNFNRNIITVNSSMNNYESVFDLKWFETLTLCTLSNKNYSLKQGMSDVSLLCLVKPSMYETKDIAKLMQNGKIVFIKLTSAKNDPSVFQEKLFKQGISEDRFTFEMLKMSVLMDLDNRLKQEPMAYYSDALKKTLVKNMQLSARAFNNYLKLSIADVKIDVLNNSDFLKLDFLDALQYLINVIASEESFKKNVIDFKNLLSILAKIENNQELDFNLEFLLGNSKEYLIRVYGYMLFSGLDLGKYQRYQEKEIFDSFKSDISYGMGHAKNVWKEYIKKIKNTIKVLEDNNEYYHRIKYYERMLELYERKMSIIASEEQDSMVFSLIRNAFTHGHVKLDKGTINLRDYEPAITVWKINSKTNKLESKEFLEKSHTFEMTLEEETLLKMFDLLYKERKVNISTNIARSCNRIRK